MRSLLVYLSEDLSLSPTIFAIQPQGEEEQLLTGSTVRSKTLKAGKREQEGKGEWGHSLGG